MRGFNHKEALFSYSKLRAAQCLYRWHLYYVRGITSRVTSKPMQLGSLVHIGLHAVLTGRTPRDAMREQYDQWRTARNPTSDHAAESLVNLEDAVVITLRAYRHLTDMALRTAVSRDGELMSEFELEAPLRNWAGFVGFADWIAEDQDGNLWVVDFKVREQLRAPDEIETDLQLMIYLHLLRQMGYPIAGAVNFQIRAAVPKQPSLNKNGTMSRTNVMTDWDTYSRALIAAGLDPYEYDDMRVKLDERVWFDFNRQTWPDKYLSDMWYEVVQKAAWSIGSANHPWRNMTGLNCIGCWAREFCLEEMRDPERAQDLIDAEDGLYRREPWFHPDDPVPDEADDD